MITFAEVLQTLPMQVLARSNETEQSFSYAVFCAANNLELSDWSSLNCEAHALSKVVDCQDNLKLANWSLLFQQCLRSEAKGIFSQSYLSLSADAILQVKVKSKQFLSQESESEMRNEN